MKITGERSVKERIKSSSSESKKVKERTEKTPTPSSTPILFTEGKKEKVHELSPVYSSRKKGQTSSVVQSSSSFVESFKAARSLILEL